MTILSLFPMIQRYLNLYADFQNEIKIEGKKEIRKTEK